MKKTHARPGRSDHLRKRLLADFRNHRLRFVSYQSSPAAGADGQDVLVRGSLIVRRNLSKNFDDGQPSCVLRPGFETSGCACLGVVNRRLRRRLLCSDLCWRLVSMPCNEPGFVVARGELDERGAQLFDRIEGLHPKQVLLQGSYRSVRRRRCPRVHAQRRAKLRCPGIRFHPGNRRTCSWSHDRDAASSRAPRRARWLRSTDARLVAPAPAPRTDWPNARRECQRLPIGVFHGDEDIGPAFPESDRLRHVRSPHFIDFVGDDRSIVRLGLGPSGAMRREQAVLAHHPPHAPRARANASEAQPRPYLAVAFAVKAESGDLSADMFRQLRVRTCSDGTRTRRDRVRPRLAAKTISVPHPTTISVFELISGGDRNTG